MKRFADTNASAAPWSYPAGPAQGGDSACTRTTSGTRGTWALVLAGDNGARLQAPTVGADGTAVPRQYCTVNGHQSLLASAIHSAEQVASRARTLAVVSAEHGRWWQTCVSGLSSDNVIVQPRNRGTAPGILLPLLEILDRDPEADVVVFAADHDLADENALRRGIRQALPGLRKSVNGVVLLGVGADDAHPDQGYILPSRSAHDGTYRVRRFAEKPQCSVARRLIAAGALLNSHIIVARASRLLELFVQQCPVITRVLMDARQDSLADSGWSLETAYRVIPTIDFSRQILVGAESMLRVVRLSRCNWRDLGTPERSAKWYSRNHCQQLPAGWVRGVEAARVPDLLPSHLRHSLTRREPHLEEMS